MALSVGVAIIMRNEPLERVAMLVEYLRVVASQFSIVDTGSDNIEQVRATLSAIPDVTFNEFAWVDDFAAARNHALSFLTTDLVLHVDCDELPSWGMVEYIKRIQSRPIRTVKAWRFFTKNFWGIEWGIEHPDHWHYRLFMRENAQWFRKLHEGVMINGVPEAEFGTIGELAPKEAYLIHAKPHGAIEVSGQLYKKLEGS